MYARSSPSTSASGSSLLAFEDSGTKSAFDHPRTGEPTRGSRYSQHLRGGNRGIRPTTWSRSPGSRTLTPTKFWARRHGANTASWVFPTSERTVGQCVRTAGAVCAVCGAPPRRAGRCRALRRRRDAPSPTEPRARGLRDGPLATPPDSRATTGNVGGGSESPPAHHPRSPPSSPHAPAVPANEGSGNMRFVPLGPIDRRHPPEGPTGRPALSPRPPSIPPERLPWKEERPPSHQDSPTIPEAPEALRPRGARPVSRIAKISLRPPELPPTPPKVPSPPPKVGVAARRVRPAVISPRQ